MGQTYNVGSTDESSNLDLCRRLLDLMGIAHNTPEASRRWVKYTHDRPFNDRRYAVDGSKLRKLGWEPKTSFEAGLRTTVDWYRQFGEGWWGDISHVLTPFPVVSQGEVKPDLDHLMRDEPQRRAEEYKGNGIRRR